MPKMIAKRKLRYAGRQLKAGDSFQASEKDARTLSLIGSAEDAPIRKYKRRDLSAEA